MADIVLERMSWLVGSIAVRLGRLGFGPVQMRPRFPATDISLTCPDGVGIAGTYWPGRHPRSPALLIVHGYMANRKTVKPNAAWFAAQGYAVLTIDLRGHGQSGGADCGFGWPESQDVHMAFAWLKRKQGGAKVAAIGISMGGAALLLGPSGPVPADAMVLQAVFPDIDRAIRGRVALVGGQFFAAAFAPLLCAQAKSRIGVDAAEIAPIDAVKTLACPVLVAGGGKDVFTPPPETLALFEAVNAPKWLFMMNGLGHNGISRTSHPAYRERVLRFLHDAAIPPES